MPDASAAAGPVPLIPLDITDPDYPEADNG
jgi:hypothetical protein